MQGREGEVESSQHAGVSLHPASSQQHGIVRDKSEWPPSTHASDAPVKMQNSWQSVCCRHVCTLDGNEV